MMPREIIWQALSSPVGRQASRVSSMKSARKVASVTNAVTCRLSRYSDIRCFQDG